MNYDIKLETRLLKFSYVLLVCFFVLSCDSKKEGTKQLIKLENLKSKSLAFDTKQTEEIYIDLLKLEAIISPYDLPVNLNFHGVAQRDTLQSFVAILNTDTNYVFLSNSLKKFDGFAKRYILFTDFSDIRNTNFFCFYEGRQRERFCLRYNQNQVEYITYDDGLKDGPYLQISNLDQLKTEGQFTYIIDTTDINQMTVDTFISVDYDTNEELIFVVRSDGISVKNGTWKYTDKDGKTSVTNYEKGVVID